MDVKYQVNTSASTWDERNPGTPLLALSDVRTHQVMKHRILALVPAYNEERFIASVVLKARRYAAQVIVIDDGSTDETAALAEAAGAEVICHRQNKGKGAALNSGFRAARRRAVDAVVVLDADGQHCPEELSLVVEPILAGEADIVIGSRYLEPTSEVPAHRVWGHKVFNFLTGAASGVSATDSQSGFRAFSPMALEALSFNSNGFSVESEMQFIAREYNLRLVEVPITIRYTDKPKRPVLVHGLNVLNGILRLMGQMRPLLFFSAPGLLLLLSGLGLGVSVVDIYRRVEQLAAGYAMLSVLLTIVGMLSLSTGIILHSVRGLLSDFLNQLRQ
jgi:glycosyltransferase involved in cell wall biosynthesis